MLELLLAKHVIFIVFKRAHLALSYQWVCEAFLFKPIVFCVIRVFRFVWCCNFIRFLRLSSFTSFFLWEGQFGFDILTIFVSLLNLMLSNVLRFLIVSLHGVLLLHVIFVPFTCVILKHDVIQVISHFLLSFAATPSSLFKAFLGMLFFTLHSCLYFRVHRLQFRLISSPINLKVAFWHVKSECMI